MQSGSPIQCLDEDAILAFCSSRLPPGARGQAEAHIASCDECRALVSAVARSSVPDIAIAPTGIAPTTPIAGGAHSSGSSSSPVSPGQVLAGKYVVERVLGRGGMGIVVAARHTQLEQRVALKFLLPAACEVPGAVARFLREGKAAARIASEHVARVVDTGVLEGGAPYLVMEYLEGEDLGRHLETQGPLPPAVAIDYVMQACEAIVEAHALGIVHRDLKPANLFLTARKDGSPLVKVLDFGISKLDGGSHRDLTSATALMGSPRYMSPEQMLSARDVDARTDVWALGVILFELVTGRPPWDADTVQGLCGLITTAPAPPLRSFVPTASIALESAIARCLVKNCDQRIASVGDLAIALEAIAPPTAKTSIERILRVSGRASTAVAVVAPPSSSRAGLWIGLGVFALLVASIFLALVVPKKKEAVPEPQVVAAAVTPAVSAAPTPSTEPSAAALPTADPTPIASTKPRPGAPAHPSPRPSAKPNSAPPPVVIAPPPAPVDTGKALSERK